MTEQRWTTYGDGWQFYAFVDFKDGYVNGERCYDVPHPTFRARWTGKAGDPVEHGQYGDYPILTVNGVNYADVDVQLEVLPGGGGHVQLGYIGGHRVNWVEKPGHANGGYEKTPFGPTGWEAFTDKARDTIIGQVKALLVQVQERGTWTELLTEAYEAKAAYIRQQAEHKREEAERLEAEADRVLERIREEVRV